MGTIRLSSVLLLASLTGIAIAILLIYSLGSSANTEARTFFAVLLFGSAALLVADFCYIALLSTVPPFVRTAVMSQHSGGNSPTAVQNGMHHDGHE